jgi:hypothetical protein
MARKKKVTKKTTKKATRSKGGINAKLKKLNARWKKAEAKTGGFSLPEGTYPAKITSCKIGEAQESGRLQAETEFTVIDGEYKGKKCRRYDGLEEDEQMEYLKGMIETLEAEVPETLDALGDCLTELVGIACEIYAKSKDEFLNIYVNGLIDEDDYETDEPEDEPEDEDDEEEESEEEDDEEIEDDDEEDEEEDDDEEIEEEDEDEEEEPEPPKKTRKKKTVKKATNKKKSKRR